MVAGPMDDGQRIRTAKRHKKKHQKNGPFQAFFKTLIPTVAIQISLRQQFI